MSAARRERAGAHGGEGRARPPRASGGRTADPRPEAPGRASRTLAVAAILAVAAACSRTATLPVDEIPPGQQLAAMRGAAYALAGPDGTTGQARLWSNGLVTGEGPPALTVSLALVAGSGPLSIGVVVDRAQVGAADGTLSGPVAPRLSRSEVLVTRGGFALGDAAFLLPEGVAPGAVACFRVDWHAVIRDVVLPHTTVFVRDRTAPPPAGPRSAAFVPSGDPASCAVGAVPGLGR